jgi:hypothetical protein
MKLSDQALEQSDIVPVIKGFEFVPAADQEGDEAQLFVKNPPLVKLGNEDTVEEDE